MTLKDRIVWLEEHYGGLRAAAVALDIDAGFLCRMKSGKKFNPSNETLRKLGLRRKVTYELDTKPC